MNKILQNKILWMIVVFTAAAIFRLNSLDLMEFKLDEARDVYEMERFFKEPFFIARGTIQSTGVYNPPLWYYFLALVSLPSRDPQYLALVVAILNCVAVAGLYWVIRKFYGQWVGVASGLLLAFSPWAILLSRKIWAPDLIMVLLVPWFYFMLKLVRSPSPLASFATLLLLSLLAQLHASGLFLAAGTLMALLVIRPRINWQMAVLGLVISLVPLIPYLVYQLQNSCPDCQALISFQSEESFDGNVFLRPLELINGASFDIVLGGDYQLLADSFGWVRMINMVFLLELGLGIVGVVYLLDSCLRRHDKRRSYYLLMLILIGVVPLLYFITKTPAHLYYFLILLPIMMVIYSLGIKWLGSVSKNLWIPTFVGMTVVIINIIFELTFYYFLDKKQNIQGDYGPIYRITAAQAEESLSSQKNNPDYNLIRAEYFVNLFNDR